ncbi:hypothetical protein G6O69_19490 [Pseudenhygromyxa sp. WMMC2535]|uniref:hypothetical protein n=1 Tax=Pseudenhygromyxa sp. WMMC2535 TaxID=2712867 RepID=UPI001552141A|nr:hypothetical protein [Pseudenhygromyxa sp. WMMC2535]NVB40038.1 hypothetical protein [Pseudenhygromyxa sp. WMMC2535]
MTSPSKDTIARELAALDEAPLSEDERALLESEGALEGRAEIAEVARMHELAEPLAFEDLSELELHRGWRRVEARSAPAPDEQGSTRGRAGGGGRRRWPLAAAGLAAAAVLAVLVLREGEGPSQTELAELAEVGEHARSLLEALDDGVGDSERAAALAADYERRLRAGGGG